MTVYLDLWLGRGISRVAKWQRQSVRVFGLIHGPPENSSLLGQNQKIPAFYKIYSSIPFRQ